MAVDPVFNWRPERKAGILLHPTALPSSEGIGTLGDNLKYFLEFLKEAQLPLWQSLPLGPTSYGDSPYSALSIYAGNPYLIDCKALVQLGLLTLNDLEPVMSLPLDHVDYSGLYRRKWPVLKLAHKRFVESGRAYLPNYGLFDEFYRENRHWLEAFTAYMALKEHFGGKPWSEWDSPYRDYETALESPLLKDLETNRQLHAFTQYLFYAQWNSVRAYATELEVDIMGDIPIFVSMDSADVWANRELFKLDSEGRPTVVAGVPPDYFSESGQLWGNPLYDWKKHAADEYQWWLDRLGWTFKFYDLIRLDHFRGFADYWEIPAGNADARKGKWVDGPGTKFFKAVKKEFPDARLIAEDLGEIDDKVRKLLKDTGLPGMAVLHFAFDGHPDNEFLPCNLSPERVVYTGTHDNDTSRGWYDSQEESIRDQVRRYLTVDGSDISWDLIRAAYKSVCHTSIFPLQDLLSLGTEARMNYPGKPQGNWQWRMSHEQLDSLWQHKDYFRGMAWLYNRVPFSDSEAKKA